MYNFFTKKLNNKKGFTLLEFILIIALVGTVVLFGGKELLDNTARSNNDKVEVQTIEKPIRISVNSSINYLSLTQTEAEKLFIIKNNTIVGLTSDALDVRNLTLPDAIEGKAVDISYETLKTFTNDISITLERSKVDTEAANRLEEQQEQQKHERKGMLTKLILGTILMFIAVIAHENDRVLISVILFIIGFVFTTEPTFYTLSETAHILQRLRP